LGAIQNRRRALLFFMTTLRVALCVFGAMVAAGAAPAPSVPAAARDGALERAIRAKFERSKIRVEGFTVRVERGTAILEERTKVIQRKGTASRLAKLAGARVADNRIQVDEAARELASENLAKGRRRAQVKRGESKSERTPQQPPPSAPTAPVAAAPVVSNRPSAAAAASTPAPKRAIVKPGK